MKWRVFPTHGAIEGPDGKLCCTCGKPGCSSPAKHPRTKNGFRDATDDPEQIRKWFEKWPASNIGIATGSGLVVIDIDGAEGAAEFKELVATHGAPPATLIAQTGRGVHALYFTRPDSPEVRSSARGRVHVRGEGGFIIAAPSRHITGRLYQWVRKNRIAELPDWLRQWTQGYEVSKEKSQTGEFRGLGQIPAYLQNSKSVQPDVTKNASEALKTVYSPSEHARIASALQAIPVKTCSYDDFLRIGMALKELDWQKSDGTDIGYELWDAWCSLSEHHNPKGLEFKWRSFKRSGVSIGSLYHMAQQHGWSPVPLPAETEKLNGHHAPSTALPEAFLTAMQGAILPPVKLEDFHAYMPMHNYIWALTGDMWPAPSVNARIPKVPLFDAHRRPVLDDEGKPKKIAAATWLDQNRPVEQMTWAPGMPVLIQDSLIAEGGWVRHPGARCFNLYKPPSLPSGNPMQAMRWVDHVRRVYGESAPHIIYWLAHRCQRPQDKINHALVLGGKQGIGKDTLIEPAKRAIGAWNFQEVSPQQALGRFNGFLKAVILRISEARDLGDVDRYAFYDHMKAYAAAPPDVLRVDQKHVNEHSIMNVVGVIITTNNKTDGIYLPADDRRHYVAWSELTKDDFTAAYWNELWGWYNGGGDRDIAAYLRNLDISKFDAKAPPPKTSAFWEIVGASNSPEDAELADAIDRLGTPDVFTLDQLSAKATGDLRMWIAERKNRRSIPHRLEKCGYIPIRNEARNDGLWIINATRQVLYGMTKASVPNRVTAARKLALAETRPG